MDWRIQIWNTQSRSFLLVDCGLFAFPASLPVLMPIRHETDIHPSKLRRGIRAKTNHKARGACTQAFCYLRHPRHDYMVPVLHLYDPWETFIYLTGISPSRYRYHFLSSMALKLETISLICLSVLEFTLATPAVDVQDLEARQAVDNIVYVTDSNLFWCVPYLPSF